MTRVTTHGGRFPLNEYTTSTDVAEKGTSRYAIWSGNSTASEEANGVHAYSTSQHYNIKHAEKAAIHTRRATVIRKRFALRQTSRSKHKRTNCRQ